MNFRVVGSGPIPLICIHGWCCEGAQFDELARLLDGQFQIYLPDLPGHGSTPLGDFQPSFQTYADAIAGFAIAQGLETASLFGHSMGGILVLMVAASGRVQPRAVINLDGSLPAAAHVLPGLAKVRSWLDEPDFLDRLAPALREVYFLPQERDTRCDAIVQSMCAAPESVHRFLPEQAADLDASTILPKIHAPTLYIGADRPRFDADRALDLLPHLQVEHLAGTGHFLHIFAPERVASHVRAFAS